MSATPCHLYYDLEVANQSLSDTSTPPSELTFTEVRASAVLSNPNEYFMSIVRFSVDTAGSLPVFLPQIDLAQPTGGANFPNVTVYNISLPTLLFLLLQLLVLILLRLSSMCLTAPKWALARRRNSKCLLPLLQ